MAPGPEGYRVVVNADAGGADQRTLPAVRDALAAGGAVVEVVATEDVDEVAEVVRSVPDSWALVACGGDGSLHVLVQQLWSQGRTDVRVGLVPAGTGNDLARGLGLPLDDPAAAAEAVARGRARRLDLLVDDADRVCVNALHVGVGAEAAERADDLKERLARLAYPVSALLSGLGEPVRETVVDVDGATVVEGETLLVGVCNGPSVGGGTRLAPDADPSDGLLDVVVVAAADAGERVAFALDLQRGRHLDRSDVRLHRGREVVLRMPGARHDVDGEVEEPSSRPRRWRLEPAAWSLLT